MSHDDDKIVQLLASFDDEFPYADSLGFVLKSVDVFERYNDGKHGARTGERGGKRLADDSRLGNAC